MFTIKEKIPNIPFKKTFKRLLIALICVLVLGGGTSAFLMRDSISTAITSLTQEEKHTTIPDYSYPKGHDKNHRDKEEIVMMIMEQSPTGGKVFAMGTFIVSVLLSLAIYIILALWLYHVATISAMTPLLWLVLGLIAPIFAQLLFLIIRSFIRQKCPHCGVYQSYHAQYCSVCGTSLTKNCPHCGATIKNNDAFCSSCGQSLK